MNCASPLLIRSDQAEGSVFQVENLLREARRQLSVADGAVPEICVLDPDGDIARHVQTTGMADKSPVWACYHTMLYQAPIPPGTIGIVPFAVGAPFAVLVAEELFASGCKLLISLTSAGRIASDIPRSCYVVIDRALRGEGASYAYVPASDAILADTALASAVHSALLDAAFPVVRGTSWTTDAPFRETASALCAAAEQGALVVEMEAAALYAFAQATSSAIVCLAHVTNDMAVDEGDFENGASNGAEQALSIVDIIAGAFRQLQVQTQAAQ